MTGWEAPELVCNRSDQPYTNKVDIYGCGLVMACLLCWGTFKPRHFNEPQTLLQRLLKSYDQFID